MSIINLYKEHPETNKLEIIGAITEDQLDFLNTNFECDFEEDEAYLLDNNTIDFLKIQKADNNLIALLEKALAETKDGVDILYLEE